MQLRINLFRAWSFLIPYWIAPKINFQELFDKKKTPNKQTNVKNLEDLFELKIYKITVCLWYFIKKKQPTRVCGNVWW